ncbi:MAG TPA: hypothetical protein VLT51_00905 [Anaerolineales bacterium]|nr:hypothetical protein [Anaerolineales bacterium]
MNHSPNLPSTHLPVRPRMGHKVSQRGLFSIAMFLICVGGLGSALLGGAKIVVDILGDKSNVSIIVVMAQMIVIGLAYIVGWVTAMVAIRVYGNLVLPILINWFTWGCLFAMCYLYIAILQRMYTQPEELGRFFKYLVLMAGGLVALIGLHLIIEGHDLRPFSIPFLIIGLTQLAMIVVRYVFDSDDVKPGFLWKDLVFFFAMITVSISMLAHWGILEPFRTRLTNFFDRNSTSIRTQD